MVVQDKINAFDIETTGRYIGRDKNSAWGCGWRGETLNGT
jgi:hypothetical protein